MCIRDRSIYLREAEKTLATRFGRKVHIINGRKKGKIEREYYLSLIHI